MGHISLSTAENAVRKGGIAYNKSGPAGEARGQNAFTVYTSVFKYEEMKLQGLLTDISVVSFFY